MATKRQKKPLKQCAMAYNFDTWHVALSDRPLQDCLICALRVKSSSVSRKRFMANALLVLIHMYKQGSKYVKHFRNSGSMFSKANLYFTYESCKETAVFSDFRQVFLFSHFVWNCACCFSQSMCIADTARKSN